MEKAIIEIKGQVKFFKDEEGNLYQQINETTIYKVIDGKISYKNIKTIKDYNIKYNINGVYGFSIWKDNIDLEDNFWNLEEVEKIVNDMIFHDMAEEIAKVRKSGLTNMFDRKVVISILKLMDFRYTAKFLEKNESKYLDLLKLSGEY